MPQSYMLLMSYHVKCVKIVVDIEGSL